MITNYLHYRAGTPLQKIQSEIMYKETTEFGKIYITKELLTNIYEENFKISYELTFNEDVLVKILCRFNFKTFDKFKKSFENDLPKGIELDKDPFNDVEGYYCFTRKLMISFHNYPKHILLFISERCS